MTRRRMPVRAALEWAFGVERASVEFDSLAEDRRPEVSTVWVMMQRGQLGCRIDGGGWSPRPHDAEVIAATVARLPRDLGGRRMALRVAELARAGAAPDWGRDLRPRCVPVAWRGENQFGRQAATERVGVERILWRGRLREVAVLCCPVTYTASPDRIAAARRGYLAWIEALAWIAAELRYSRQLDRIEITADLPEFEPWRAVAQGRDAQAA